MSKIGAIFSLLELGMVFLLVMGFIWFAKDSRQSVLILGLGLIFITQIIHNQSPLEGLSGKHFAKSAKLVLPWLVVVLVAIFFLALVLYDSKAIRVGILIKSLRWYLPWALAQQYLLNSYFVTKLETSLVANGFNLKPNTLAIIVAVVFALIHLPNPFLCLVTLVGGFVFSRLYLKFRDIYSLTIAHAFTGGALIAFLPTSVTLGLAIGPNCFRYFSSPWVGLCFSN